MARAVRHNTIVSMPSVETIAPALATDDAIARRAFEIYESRGASDGADLDDWLQAERELTMCRSS